jgi:hypothetical protein
MLAYATEYSVFEAQVEIILAPFAVRMRVRSFQIPDWSGISQVNTCRETLILNSFELKISLFSMVYISLGPLVVAWGLSISTESFSFNF